MNATIRNLICLLLILFSSFSIYDAQGQMYTFSTSNGTYSDLIGTTSLNNGQVWDDPVYMIEIGFSFQFYNQSFDTLYVSQSHIAFDTLDDYVIGVIDAEYNFDLTDRGAYDSISVSPISYQLSGAPGSQILKIEWQNVGFWGEDDSVGTLDDSISYQLWLYEGINTVEVHIGPNSVMPYSYEGFSGPNIGVLDFFVGNFLVLNGNPASPGIGLSEYNFLTGTPVEGTVYEFMFGGHCTNGVQDVDEAGVDCGGSGCPVCHCSNNIQDADETGIDCGGADCEECWPDEACDFDNTLDSIWIAPVVIGDSLFDTCIFAGEYITVQNMIAGNTYRISTCYNNYVDDDLQLTIYPSGDTINSVTSNDDYCGYLSQIFFTPDSSGDYDILLDEWGVDTLSQDTNYIPCMHLDECRTVVVELMDTVGGSCGPKLPQICMVTYDIILDKNVVIWEKSDSVIQAYNIYRETNEQNKFDLIGTVPIDSLSEFIDNSSNPKARQYRYKISASDGCGMESEKSDFHKTMHLSKNVGIGGEVNLIWSEYEGYTYASIIVMRYSPTDTVVLDTLPSNLNFYTDLTPPPGNLDYQLKIIHPTGGCTVDKTKNFNSSKSNTSSYYTPAILSVTSTTVNATQSNCDGTATVTPSGGSPPYTYLWSDPLAQSTQTASNLCAGTYSVLITDDIGDTISTTVAIGTTIGIQKPGNYTSISIFPNPNNGTCTLTISSVNENMSLYVLNVLGQTVIESTIDQNKMEIDLSDRPSGIYYFKFVSNKTIAIKRVIVE